MNFEIITRPEGFNDPAELEKLQAGGWGACDALMVMGLTNEVVRVQAVDGLSGAALCPAEWFRVWFAMTTLLGQAAELPDAHRKMCSVLTEIYLAQVPDPLHAIPPEHQCACHIVYRFKLEQPGFDALVFASMRYPAPQIAIGSLDARTGVGVSVMDQYRVWCAIVHILATLDLRVYERALCRVAIIGMMKLEKVN